MNPPGQPGAIDSCLPRSSSSPHRESLFDQTEMATTVGATLASSKLVVTQDDLHLVGSPVDQLVLCFDQTTFDKRLATARVKVNKAKKRRHETRATGPQCILTASSPHGNLSS